MTLLIKTLAAVAATTLLGAGAVAQDKYALTSPSGIAFADFRGYEEDPQEGRCDTTP